LRKYYDDLLGENMSLSKAEKFECPYCMTYNDLEIDEANDVGQQLIVDCQVCCSPIELSLVDNGFHIEIIATRDDD
jgi:hypothetical protein